MDTTMTFDGYCDECRGRDRPRDEAEAETCGHATNHRDLKFCLPCAMRLGVCRGCGKIVRLPAARP